MSTAKTHRIVPIAQSFFFRALAAAGLVFLCTLFARAGNPRYVAGTTFFDPSVTGQPVLWPQGTLTYFTDQGDLSPILPNASANSLVADAFSQWTSISTAALSASSGGQLAEDVNGSNVTRNSDGTISMPLDIQPTATATPVGIVYDYDGSVTDAFLGAGAGSSDPYECFYNSVFGGADNFGQFAAIQHALVVINGQCVLQSSQLTDLEYRLVRVLGQVMGIGWSQLNLNVITGNPHPTPDDFAGFPVMHFMDLSGCVPVTVCYANPYAMAADDVAAVSRLYPVTSQNQSSYPGKQLFAASTARIYGSVWFTSAAGEQTQPMQGANVVARWIDPVSGQPSHRYSLSTVSGFLFTGNAGNPITGFLDAMGNPYSNWGSSQASQQGFFDLAGLPFPNGATSGQYQLTLEGIDALWSEGVGPYAPYQVAPSGTVQPIVVNASPGIDVAQDILMTATAQPVPSWAASATWTNPAPIPAAGDWIGSLDTYGDTPYFSLTAQANRTLSVAVTALDELGNASELKAQPVIGIWSASDPQGMRPPALTTSPFNSQQAGTTLLNAQILSSTKFRVGISDLRGDGRPDYHYHAHILYGDSVSPARLSASGGPITVKGIGLTAGQTVKIGSNAVTPLSVNAGQMILNIPAAADGTETVTISDPATGASSIMTGAVEIGAQSSDSITLLPLSVTSAPVGTACPGAIKVKVLAADGITPVSGATVAWSSTSNTGLSACGGATACSASSDEAGIASTYATPTVAGVANITAALAPASYKSPKSVTAQVLGTANGLAIAAATPYIFVAQGATVSTPLTVRVVNNGTPQSGTTVNYQIMSGAGAASLSSGSAPTSGSGYAMVTLSLTNVNFPVQISACVAPANNPCQTIAVAVMPLAQLQLQPVDGSNQILSTGQAFSAISVRVADSAPSPNPVLGAGVLFQTLVVRPGEDGPAGGQGGMPVILSSSQNTVLSDINGLASVLPSTGSFGGELQVDVTASAGTSASLSYVLETVPVAGGSGSQPVFGSHAPTAVRPSVPLHR